MRVFVPVEDAPSSASIPMLVPYRCGLICEHAMREPVKSDWSDKASSVGDPGGQDSPRRQFVEA